MTFEVLTSATCRWSIRNIVALREKRAAYTLVDVTTSEGKAPWFLALTPFGKTPGLRHAGEVVVESQQINEYIDATASGRALLPSDPLRRTWARIWNGYCDDVLMRGIYRLTAAVATAERAEALDHFDRALARADKHLFQHAQGVDGFWGGERLSLTDICYWTLFDVLARIDSLADARGRLECHPTLQRWSTQLLGHPSFRTAEAELAAMPAHPARGAH